MRKKALIGIISRPSILENKKTVLGVYQNYADKIIKNGGIPILILKTKNIEDLITLLNQCDGILMPGGDVGDEMDYFITNYVIRNNIPVLGICLGMQLISEYFDGKLVETSNHYLTYHPIYVKKESFLYDIYKKENMNVNSRHHYKIINLKEKYISAVSEDGVIEGVEDKTNRFCIGVEWHPEDLENDILFKRFIKASEKD